MRILPMINLPVLSDNTINNYFKRIFEYPELSKEDEIDLFQKYRLYGDKDAFKQLSLSTLRYAAYAALKYKRTGYIKDIFQEAVKAIMVAFDKFDVTKNKRFSDYVNMWIKAYVHDYLMKHSMILSYGGSDYDRKIWNNIEKDLNEIYSNPKNNDLTNDEIMILLSEKMDIPIEDIRDNYIVLNKLGFNLDESFYNPYDDKLVTTDIEDEFIYDEVEETEKKKLMKYIDTSGLTEKEKTVILARYFSNTELPKSMVEIAKEMGVSKQLIDRFEKSALQKMKNKRLLLNDF